jgi:Taurine catabolism dioxygenase TauD, TfdA family
MPPANLFPITGNVAATIRQATADLPEPSLDSGGRLADGLHRRYQERLTACDETHDLRQAIDHGLTTTPKARGYLVLDCRELIAGASQAETLKILTALLTLIGTPMRVFDDWDLWKPLGTNTEVPPERATGTGYNPLHIDVVNSTMPPAYSCLLCVREDPRGAGDSLVANLQEAVSGLSPEEVEYLKAPMYRDGNFYRLSGVGVEFNPFPVLEWQPDGLWMVRFTAKMLPEMGPGPHQEALRALERLLMARQEQFLLGEGQLLIVNQRLVCHGRMPLGEGQSDLPPSERRALLQIFLHSADGRDSSR